MAKLLFSTRDATGKTISNTRRTNNFQKTKKEDSIKLYLSLHFNHNLISTQEP